MTQLRFSIQFLGTGNAWSKPPINYNTNALIEVRGHRWLLDCGALCPLALSVLGVDQSTIDAVFLSHLHGDHCRGVEELLLRRFFEQRGRHALWLPKPFVQGGGLKLWDHCLRAALESEVLGRSKPLELSDYADVLALECGVPFDAFGLECTIFEVQHAAKSPAFGVRLGDDVVFTSDTRFDGARLERWVQEGVRTIFHEVSFAPPGAGNIHTAFEELAQLPASIRQRIVLMHYGDDTPQSALERACTLGFCVAKPGQTFVF